MVKKGTFSVIDEVTFCMVEGEAGCRVQVEGEGRIRTQVLRQRYGTEEMINEAMKKIKALRTVVDTLEQQLKRYIAFLKVCKSCGERYDPRMFRGACTMCSGKGNKEE